jgi:hypothetical protein
MIRKIGIVVLLLFVLLGCSRKRLPKFSVITTDDELLYVDRVSVNPGIFPLGTRFKVGTAHGVTWIEKDLSGVKDIYFFHGGDQQDRACNTIITYSDKSDDMARCDPASVLICESVRGREEIPFTKITSISRNK